ncbi:MAG TPA: hypothetical protein VMB72_15625 [Acidimicrobiales bacterium]|nr:hypothetical protein [Acidimicrobiales bacterium]
MRIRPVGFLHSVVTLVVLVELGFAAAFAVDAARTNAAYDALVAHHVRVEGTVVGCATLGGQRGYVVLCRADYRYGGDAFTAVIPRGETASFLVDPRDTADRMDAVTFAKGPEETTGDEVVVVVLAAAAVATVAVHLGHVRHRRRRGRTGGPAVTP